MEKRKEPRRDYLSRVEIEGTTADGTAFRIEGMIEDRSPSGFGIRVKEQIPANTNIRIRQAGRLFHGIVRHCARERDSFFLGIQARNSVAAPTTGEESA